MRSQIMGSGILRVLLLGIKENMITGNFYDAPYFFINYYCD
ncbi:hypothetical protein RO3G_04593 [Rhizopus delemar RA 99-880]|uniref:Uncharacterized protein n=1 Tax=Rhizopus delemar (strain RA 99-880 / ATCC MYA-4621 / FGSC 9543 / NRRL 43880) TaxID=246409 RepID=I1BUK8_RHIO9|nr:hypothetical protein RO3G_04593 [Rhizopus delemar RA 99-880]|eukprot:EIE79888.1 hypothetical protein RO3G_04593 [Rhizopus delemar RA 99-880]